MISLSKMFMTWITVIAALFLCTACSGMNETQLALDPVYAETQKMSNFISRQRTEFFQLRDAYVKTKKHIHLERMREMAELMRDELDRAEYFTKNHKYYRKGIDYERWKSAEYTHNLCRKTLCEMMLTTGEMQMLYWDKEYAASLFTAVASGFENADTGECAGKARYFLQEIERYKLIASSDNQ